MSGEPAPPAADGSRKLTALMFTDIVGFSRQMGANEAHMLRRLAVHNQLIQHAVTEHHGHVIKTIGDAFLVDFPSVVNAVQCAQHIQQQFKLHNAEKEATEQIHIRIGVHLGDIVQQDGDVFGDGVNVASRLQGLAAPDTICIVSFRWLCLTFSAGRRLPGDGAGQTSEPQPSAPPLPQRLGVLL
ncbi:MAG: adenylate/guanylate cyclase domain-containing protein [Deltaproteobacteria bacterium]|nr:adenylate/guanylate cyclase domain-containing protein [Deltaproteobacteria bacterium]